MYSMDMENRVKQKKNRNAPYMVPLKDQESVGDNTTDRQQWHSELNVMDEIDKEIIKLEQPKACIKSQQQTVIIMEVETVKAELQAEDTNQRLEEEVDKAKIHLDELREDFEGCVVKDQQRTDQMMELQAKNKALQQAMEDQSRAHQLSMEMLKAVLQGVKDTDQSLEEEMDMAKIHLDELREDFKGLVVESQKRTDQMMELQAKNKALQQALEDQSRAHQLSMETVKAELQAEKDSKQSLQEELDKAHFSHTERLRQALEMAEDLQENLNKIAKSEIEKQERENIQNLPQVLQTQRKSCSPPEGEATTKMPSTWVRFRHALGLRKPQRWKKAKKQKAD